MSLFSTNEERSISFQRLFSSFNLCQLLLQMNTVFQMYSLIKSFKGNMLYKRDFIYLYIINFSSEFNGFDFLAPDNRTKVMPVDTRDAVRNFFACK